MNQDRVAAVADAIAELGYNGIVAFDRYEPEYDTIDRFQSTFDNQKFVDLLLICATTADYQLNGDAQRFWARFETVGLEYGRLNSESDVKKILSDFMEESVNARLNQQKRDRIARIFENGFGNWFVTAGFSAKPFDVWKRLADALETKLRKKTVVLAMKIYDIAHLTRTGKYLEFPSEIPIPCDLQVKRVSRTAGLIDSENADRIMDAWAAVMDRVSEALGLHVSLLRIDSIVWQAGQIIGDHEPDPSVAHKALISHFEEVGIHRKQASVLATELTAEL